MFSNLHGGLYFMLLKVYRNESHIELNWILFDKLTDLMKYHR